MAGDRECVTGSPATAETSPVVVEPSAVVDNVDRDLAGFMRSTDADRANFGLARRKPLGRRFDPVRRAIADHVR